VETRSGRVLRELALAQGQACGVWTRPWLAFSVDNRLVAAGVTRFHQTKEQFRTSFEGAQIWDVVTGEALAHVGSDSCGCIAFSPDGRTLATANSDGLCGWDVISGEQVWKYALGRVPQSNYARSFAGHIEFSPDGRSIAAAMPDSTVLLWDVPASRRKPAPLATPADQKAAWDALISQQASKSVAAVWALVDAGADAVTLLRNRLKPMEPISEKTVQHYIVDLGDSAFTRRDTAERKLAELGERCEPALRAALATKISLEQRNRIEKLLAAPIASQPEALRFLRAVQALEAIGSPAARTLLEDLVKGDPAAPETKTATAALSRLLRR
jgi:hypothetical protein